MRLLKSPICVLFEIFPFNLISKVKNDCNVRPTSLESHTAEGTVNYEDPGGKRGARLPAVEAPVGLCRIGEGCYGGWEKGPGQTNKNL